ncbi:MAG: hypothetical protein LCI02_04920 [Proteobacteria bacterium]|nr:hypothetical protein [Pseudomonadota bacterium]
MNAATHSDDDDPIVQRTVPAGSSAAPTTSAVSSVFALGDTPQAPSKFALPLKTRVLKSIAACGPLTAKQLATALAVDRRRATIIASELSCTKGGNLLVRTLNADGQRAYALARDGVVQPAPPRRKGGRVARPAAIAEPAAETPAADERLVCGVLNTGELLIQLPYLEARIKLGHWLELRDYLATVKLDTRG